MNTCINDIKFRDKRRVATLCKHPFLKVLQYKTFFVGLCGVLLFVLCCLPWLFCSSTISAYGEVGVNTSAQTMKQTEDKGVAWPTNSDQQASLPTTTGKYYLTQDIDVAYTNVIQAGATVQLDLNGHVVNGASTKASSTDTTTAGPVYENHGKLAITDSKHNDENTKHHFEVDGDYTQANTSNTLKSIFAADNEARAQGCDFDTDCLSYKLADDGVVTNHKVNGGAFVGSTAGVISYQANANSVLAISNCNFVGNKNLYSAGGVLSASGVTGTSIKIANSAFIGNSSVDCGGAIFIDGLTYNIHDSLFVSNTVLEPFASANAKSADLRLMGGAIYAKAEPQTATASAVAAAGLTSTATDDPTQTPEYTIKNCQVYNNNAPLTNGGIFGDEATLNLDGTTQNNNHDGYYPETPVEPEPVTPVDPQPVDPTPVDPAEPDQPCNVYSAVDSNNSAQGKIAPKDTQTCIDGKTKWIINGNKVEMQGTNQYFEAVANPGYVFSYWTVENFVNSDSQDPIIAELDANNVDVNISTLQITSALSAQGMSSSAQSAASSTQAAVLTKTVDGDTALQNGDTGTAQQGLVFFAHFTNEVRITAESVNPEMGSVNSTDLGELTDEVTWDWIDTYVDGTKINFTLSDGRTRLLEVEPISGYMLDYWTITVEGEYDDVPLDQITTEEGLHTGAITSNAHFKARFKQGVQVSVEVVAQEGTYANLEISGGTSIWNTEGLESPTLPIGINVNAEDMVWTYKWSEFDINVQEYIDSTINTGFVHIEPGEGSSVLGILIKTYNPETQKWETSECSSKIYEGDIKGTTIIQINIGNNECPVQGDMQGAGAEDAEIKGNDEQIVPYGTEYYLSEDKTTLTFIDTGGQVIKVIVVTPKEGDSVVKWTDGIDTIWNQGFVTNTEETTTFTAYVEAGEIIVSVPTSISFEIKADEDIGDDHWVMQVPEEDKDKLYFENASTYKGSNIKVLGMNIEEEDSSVAKPWTESEYEQEETTNGSYYISGKATNGDLTASSFSFSDTSSGGVAFTDDVWQMDDDQHSKIYLQFSGKAKYLMKDLAIMEAWKTGVRLQLCYWHISAA